MKRPSDDEDNEEDHSPETQVPLPHRHPFRRVIIIIARNLLCCYLLILLGLCTYIDIFGHQNLQRNVPVIVILGAGVLADNEAGDSLRARTLQAVLLYKRKIACKIICTGGLGTYPPTEAQVAAKLARSQGVPEVDLLLEMHSTNTEENTRNAAAICRQYGWTQVVAVSDPYHLWRVKRDFAAVGITAYTSPTLCCERNTHWPLRIMWTMREALAISRDELLSVSSSLWKHLKR